MICPTNRPVKISLSNSPTGVEPSVKVIPSFGLRYQPILWSLIWWLWRNVHRTYDNGDADDGDDDIELKIQLVIN